MTGYDDRYLSGARGIIAYSLSVYFPEEGKPRDLFI